MPPDSLVNVSFRVFGAHFMVRTYISTLEHRPEGFNSVSRSHTLNKFSDAVLNDFVCKVHRAPIRQHFVGINRSTP